MPIISLSQEMLDRGKDPEVGWSPAELHAVKEMKSKSGTGVNYIFEFLMTGGPEEKDVNKGRYISKLISSNALTSKPPVKETVQDFQAMIAALSGQRTSELQPDDYDTDKLVGHTCWIKITLGMYDNRPQFQITDFSADAEVPF